jgi:translation initiation factor IF-3
VNERIRISPIRVVDESGEVLGIMSADEGRSLARERGLDLVEVAANSRPPVCRIMDYGKFKYEQSKKERRAKSRQHQQQLKELKFRPKIEQHDFDFKLRNARKFLLENNKLKITMVFRGREITHAELGEKVLHRVAKELADVGIVESGPRLEGKSMYMLLTPTTPVPKKKEKDESGASEPKSAKSGEDGSQPEQGLESLPKGSPPTEKGVRT